MARQWNRKQRREMSRYGIGQQVVESTFEKEFHKKQDYDYRFAWSSMMAALVELHGFNKNQLQDIAKRTVDIRNNALCPEELIQDIKDKTGFDMHQHPSDYVYDE